MLHTCEAEFEKSESTLSHFTNIVRVYGNKSSTLEGVTEASPFLHSRYKIKGSHLEPARKMHHTLIFTKDSKLSASVLLIAAIEHRLGASPGFRSACFDIDFKFIDVLT